MNNGLFFLMFGLMVALFFTFFGGVFFLLGARPWMKAAARGAPVSFFSIVGMRLRGNPVSLILDAYIALKRAGVEASIAGVEGVYMDNKTRIRTHDDLVALVKTAITRDDTAGNS
jgi:uncharacterized protein YqfA (UPF0365 family)